MGQFTNMSDGSWVTKFDPCQVVSSGSMMYRRCRNFVRIKGLIRWLTGEVTWRSMDWCSPYGEHGACQYCRSAAEMDRRSSHLHRNIRSIEYLISSNNRFWIFIGTHSILTAALWNRTGQYIFILSFVLSIFLSFPRLISAVADWISAILPHHGVALVRI